MAILDDVLNNMPEQFRNKPRIEVLANAVAKQMEELEVMFGQLKELRNMDTAIGQQLDYCGDIVGLSRVESALLAKNVNFDVIDDDRYRLFVKYKALRNSTQCTYEELMAGCKMLYNADPIYYSELESSPASFQLSLGADMSDEVLETITTSAIAIRASGVEPKITVFAKNFFGFSDTNRLALGFGVGILSTGV